MATKKKAPPKKQPTASKQGASGSPAWKTRRVAYAALPSGPKLEAKHKISLAKLAPDGTVMGFERGTPAKRRLVRINTGGTPEPISDAGQLMCASFSADGRSVLAATMDGKLVTFPSTSDASRASECLALRGRVWSIHPLSPTRAVVAQDKIVHLVNTTGKTWKTLESVSTLPTELPQVDVLGGGKWVLVGRDPKILLFAVLKDSLRLVQSWTQLEGGLAAHDGRPFLYAKGELDRDEILNLDEVYESL